MVFNPFRFLKQTITPSYLGVDIGTTSIKVVEVASGKTLPRFLNYGMLESASALIRPTTAFQTSTLKLFEQDIVDSLRSIISEMKPKTKTVVASLPLFSVFTTVLHFPNMSPQEIEKSISFQAKQYIPLPLSEVAIDWSKVGEYEDEKGLPMMQVLLISVPQEQIRKAQSIFKSAGLNLVALEVETISLIRSLVGSDKTPTVIIDIGNRSTDIVFVDGGMSRIMRQTDFAGASLTQAVIASLNINPLRAEELKRERGILATGPNYELSTLMLPLVDAILSEVRRAQFDYTSQFPTAPKIERAILTGGGANLLGLERYVKDQLGIPAVKGAPFSKFEYPSSLEPLIPELSNPLSVALGLALKQLT